RGPPGRLPGPGEQPQPARPARRAGHQGPGTVPELSPSAQAELLLRLAVALVLGAAIGLERTRRAHAAGFRTMAMVSVGSCLFTLLGDAIVGSRTDPTRIAAQVVTGIGFLGAGTILREGGGIRGLTSAATIWVVAAIGMAAGFGFYVLAVGA